MFVGMLLALGTWTPSQEVARTLRERRLFDVEVEVILADDAMIQWGPQCEVCLGSGGPPKVQGFKRKAR